ncbi:MAG: haloacid dehalogenase type II [Ilumatobacteraceae bacterium]
MDARIAVFDINETTLDLAPVRATVDDLLGDPLGFTVWFQKLLQLSMTVTATDSYVSFSHLAPAALDTVFESLGRTVPDDAWDRVAAAMGSIEPYPDVHHGLRRLRDAGWTTVALTNSAPDQVHDQLERTGLAPLFDQILSVDAVSAFKPVAAPYRYAAAQVGVEPESTWMVACHDWDLAGARAVGMSTAFVTRAGMGYATTYPSPDLTVDGFESLAVELAT